MRRTLRRRWLAAALGASGVLACTGYAAFPEKGNARIAYDPEVHFVVTVTGTEQVSRHIDGTWAMQGCRIHGSGDGLETTTFASARPQRVVAMDNGLRREQYIVAVDSRKLAPFRARVTRTGALELDLTRPDGPTPCPVESTTARAPTNGCGTTAGMSAPNEQPLQVFGTTGIDRRRPAPGRTVPMWLGYMLPAILSSEYGLFPWLYKLEPCPSSTTATGYTIPRSSLGVGGMYVGLVNGGKNGGYPITTAGESKPLLPPRFWSKPGFAVAAEYSWSYNVLVDGDRGLLRVGTETSRVQWHAKFRRVP